MDIEKCSICWDTLESNVEETKCKHRFHRLCLGSWLKDNASCPMCRTQLKEEEKKEDLGEVMNMARVILLQRLLRDQRRTCSGCRGNFARSSVQHCGRCKRVHYCSRQCQRRDWPNHSRRCVPAKDCALCEVRFNSDEHDVCADCMQRMNVT